MIKKWIVPILGIALITSCGGGDASGPTATVVGTYTLSSVNGSSIPATFTNGSQSLKVNSGNIVINSGTTYSETTNYTETSAGTSVTTTEVCTGTFTKNGNSLSFSEASTANCGGAYTGSWDGASTLTVAFDGSFQAVYKK